MWFLKLGLQNSHTIIIILQAVHSQLYIMAEVIHKDTWTLSSDVTIHHKTLSFNADKVMQYSPLY